MIRYAFLASLLVLLLSSCQNSPYPLHKLEGRWYCQMDDGSWISETWESQSDNVMKGIGKEIVGEQETVKEYLELRKEGDALIYSATVLTQNDGNAVDFTCDSVSNDLLRFSNPQHDFPKFIEYKLIDETHINVTVGNDATEQFTLHFSKDKK